MSVRTARKYERLAQLPSQLKNPRARTRPNPFEPDWPWVQAQLERDPALRVKTLFDELCLLHPGRYQPVQLRTLQRCQFEPYTVPAACSQRIPTVCGQRVPVPGVASVDRLSSAQPSFSWGGDMAGRSKDLMDIRELIRHLRTTTSDRAVARTLGMHCKTVQRYRT